MNHFVGEGIGNKKIQKHAAPLPRNRKVDRKGMCGQRIDHQPRSMVRAQVR